MASSLCRSYEAKSLQMKKKRILREYILVLENLLCNYEVILRKRSAYLCVTLLTTEQFHTVATSTDSPIHIHTFPCVSHTNTVELL